MGATCLTTMVFTLLTSLLGIEGQEPQGRRVDGPRSSSVAESP
jgi:hypothetical protein